MKSTILALSFLLLTPLSFGKDLTDWKKEVAELEGVDSVTVQGAWKVRVPRWNVLQRMKYGRIRDPKKYKAVLSPSESESLEGIISFEDPPQARALHLCRGTFNVEF
ncbi:hypothetical protein, partial [Pelagicoccus mobilis]|uniref:hypothetical protein n=1 Tax=Pelagicoccus mobilis TaxID=415221 RepID=UPI001F32A592